MTKPVRNKFLNIFNMHKMTSQMFVEINNNKIEGRGVGCGKMKIKSNQIKSTDQS